MSLALNRGLYAMGAEELRHNWGWFVALGMILLLLGLGCIAEAVLATIFWVEFFAAVLCVSGVLSIPHAFLRRRWGGFFLELLTGLLYLVVGFAILRHPVIGAMVAAQLATLLISLLLVIGGAFRLAVGIMAPLQHRIWVILNGLVTLALGLMIWNQWPWSGTWLIGLFIGIDLFFNGWSLIMLGLVARKIPTAAAGADLRDSGAAGGPVPGAEERIFQPPSPPPAGS
jgi:uncharacterized membrane protein HdeD (DUF308 family)